LRQRGGSEWEGPDPTGRDDAGVAAAGKPAPSTAPDLEGDPGFRDGDESRSPLWMVAPEPTLNQLVGYLTEVRARLEGAPEGPHELVFSRAGLVEVRAAFARMIRRGESRLHRLCSLLCDTFLPGQYELESVVVAEVETTHERFVLSQSLAPDDLDVLTDLDLGNRQIEKLRWFDGASFRRAALVANFVEYHALEENAFGIHRIGSRIKAEEEIWNKVADEIFGLDQLVRRDKKLRELSRYVKDVFGLKIVVGDARGVQRLQKALHELEWTASRCEARGVEAGPDTSRLQFLEVKDYLGAGDRKSSGWSALKSVVRWGGTTFEIQVQPLRNYLRERERLTRESHLGFKSRREALRDEVARALPVFGFYRDLLRWLFRAPDDPPPRFAGVDIRLED
jgi:hypothetical protein